MFFSHHLANLYRLYIEKLLKIVELHSKTYSFTPQMQKQLFILIWTALIVLSCQQDTERRYDYEIQGIDVSRYQTQIDWKSIANQDMDFAFVKATESDSHVDSLFVRNWQMIKDVNMRRGAYHFYRTSSPAVLQAQHFINQVQIEEGDLPPVLDIELLGLVSPSVLRTELHQWLSIIETHYGIKPILYSNQKFYNKYLAGHFSDYPLWIARYNKEEPVLACGTKWTFWQYGHRGKLDGIEGYVDLNVFRTNQEDFDGLCLKPKLILSHK